MITRREKLDRGFLVRACILTAALTASAGGAVNVTFETIVRTGDPVPGREHLNVVFNGRAFQRSTPGVFSRPCINDFGQVVFMARSTAPNNFNQLSTIGIYLKSPGSPLQLIVDSSLNGFGNVASVGAPFPVPGRPADAIFLSGFGDAAPLINNRGDILFFTTFHSPTEGTGQGLFAVRASDGLMIKVVDTFDQVPGVPGQTFNAGFTFSGTFRFDRMLASMNDQGQIVFLGRFRQPGAPFETQGLYGVDIDGRPVAGGPIVRLADSTQTVLAGGETVPFRGFSFSNQSAINNNGTVIFQAAIGNPPPAGLLDGIFTIPVDGSAPSTTIARRGQVSPVLSDGTVRAYFSVWGGHDINDNGDFLINHSFFASFGTRPTALLAGNLATLANPLTVVADSLGGFAVPGQPSGTTFTGAGIASINEAGQMGFFARDNGPIANAQGLYAADLFGSPFSEITHNASVPPGRVAPAQFSDFQGRSAGINDLGNMVISPRAGDTNSNLGAIFGLYFFDSCTQTLERIVDDQTSLPAPAIGLGDRFLTTSEPGCIPSIFNPCERGIEIFQGVETRSGHFRSINNNDDIAFFTAFSTFNVGLYIAHVQTGGGGALRIVCPADLTTECLASDISPATTGEPRVCSDSPATVTFSDATVFACGDTKTITRTWTADDGLNQVSCDQTITVVDTTPPQIIGVPPDAAVNCDALPPPASPVVIDNCDLVPQLFLDEVQTPGTCGGEFLLKRTWTAIDACGNTTVACQILTVGDTIAPLLTPPPNRTVECGADTSPAGTGSAGATADCQGTATVTFTDAVAPGACGAATVITRTWTAADTCGNVASVDQIITVQDSTAPVITAPADATVECDADNSPAATGTAVATDGCGGAVAVDFADAVTATDLCGTGSAITRTWTATDECGNVATANQIITVVDTTAPLLTAPANVTILCDADRSPAATGSASATDGCDDMPVVTFADSIAGACPEVITRTWSAADACGNNSSATQIITVSDTIAPAIACPADIATSGGFGGTAVIFDQAPSAVDTCDASPAVTAAPASGSFFPTGVTTVTATAADACGNVSAPCSFDVLVSCFGVNRAKVGTKNIACRGIESIEFTSFNATEELISLFKAEEGSGGGVEEDTLPAVIVVDDGVNGPVTVDTSGILPIEIGDPFGPYTVSDLKKDYDDLDDGRGNEVEIRGSFVPAVPFDLTLEDLTFTIDDGAGHVATFVIPAGSFEIDGKPEKRKFKFEGFINGMKADAKFENCEFKFKVKDALNTGSLVGTSMTIGIQIGPNVASDVLAMQDKHNHLKFAGQTKVNCCPECIGIASMQVTSDQGVLVFVPGPGQTKLASNTVVDDGVNGPVTVHTSCSQPIAVGDVFGPYTISEVIKIFE